MTPAYQWSLDALYHSFEDPKLEADLEQLILDIEVFSQLKDPAYYDQHAPQAIIEAYIASENNLGERITRLSAFAGLTQSTDAKSAAAQNLLDKIRTLGVQLTEPRVAFIYWLKNHAAQLDALCTASERIATHRFALEERIEESRHLLTQEEEALIAAMTQTGSAAWEGLQNKTTSLTLIPFVRNGQLEQQPLSAIRNLAFNSDADVRKKAYEAELAAYPKFIDISAAALNAIKGEVITLTGLKGFESPLQMALNHYRMAPEILTALLQAMEEAMPLFQKYLKGKAKALGHEGALPFYDLFAPMGHSKRQLTVETCQEIVESAFRGFSTELGDFAKTAFEARWVDFEPRAGKRGGAFCRNIYGIRQSRFLCNYQGSMNNVITVAHELGHGFHGQNIFKESLLNASYPMPLAETASTFCETIVKNRLMADATPEEKLLLTETAIQGYTQIIVDIYARYLFETAVFEGRKAGSLTPEQLCELMLSSQKQAYGDGLDASTLHPYMWMNKVHYYYAANNFYNFPYAFGLLFAMGLYAKYETEGDGFAARYNDMLRLTGKATIQEVGNYMGIDLSDIDFWRGSLQIMTREIDTFLSLI